MIIGVVAAVVVLGGAIYCYRKKNAEGEAEGGDRKMFKAVIKNKSTQKQNLV